MANAIVTLKIMPQSPESDLTAIEQKCLEIIKGHNDGKDTKTAIEPIAFGLKAIKITFIIDEQKGSPDPIADKVTSLDDVMSAEVVDVRRAIG